MITYSDQKPQIMDVLKDKNGKYCCVRTIFLPYFRIWSTTVFLCDEDGKIIDNEAEDGLNSWDEDFSKAKIVHEKMRGKWANLLASKGNVL